jgi:hypothetical protein
MSATGCTWTCVGAQPNSVVRWLTPVVSHARQGQNRQFASPFLLLLSVRTCVAAGEATPYAEHGASRLPRPTSSLHPVLNLSPVPTPIPPDFLGFRCPGSTPPDRAQSFRVSCGGGARRRPWTPATEDSRRRTAASSSPPSPTRSEAAVAMVGSTKCVVGGGRCDQGSPDVLRRRSRTSHTYPSRRRFSPVPG